MYHISIENWDKIKISSIFAGNSTGNILKRDIVPDSGKTPYVTASAFNNGVVDHIDASKFKKIKGNCILVGGKTFTLTYQKEDFVSNDSHNFELHLVPNIDDENIYLFLITAIRASLQDKYKWADAVTLPKILEENIMLPLDTSGKPDWQYMSTYIREQRKFVLDKLRFLCLSNRQETNSLDLGKFKRFHLYDDSLFTIDSGTKLDKIKMTIKKPSINFVGRANANNGVTYFIDEIEGLDPYKAGYLTLSLGGEYLGSCFIQEKDFYTSQNVNVLIPKHSMSDNCKHYIATMIFREGRLHYKAFIDELNRHVNTDFTIPLPVAEDGTPDWNYIETYMENIKIKTKQRLSSLKKIAED